MPKGVYKRTEETRAKGRATMIANGTAPSIVQNRPEVIAKGLATRIRNGTTNAIVCNRSEYKVKMSIIKKKAASRADYAEVIEKIKAGKIRNGTTDAIVNNRLEKRKKQSITIKKTLGTPEHRALMSAVISGEKNPNWNNGSSFEPYSKEFNKQLKELIRYRDNYQCQKCGMPECENIRKLTVHHIDYNKKNSLPSNLISLCCRCNFKVNYNREYWTKHFREIIERRWTQSK